MLYPFLNNGVKVTSELSKHSGVPKEDYYRLALETAGGSLDDNSWVNDCDDVSHGVIGHILADYYYNKGCEVAQAVATKIGYSGKDIKDISAEEFYKMTEDIRKDVMSMDDNINGLYGDICAWKSRNGITPDNEIPKLSERFAGCFELGLIGADDSGKLNAYVSESLSPVKSLKLSEPRSEREGFDSTFDFVLDGFAETDYAAPDFCGYTIYFPERSSYFDKKAALDMKTVCDVKCKENETAVSRKKLKVIDVPEEDNDLEF